MVKKACFLFFILTVPLFTFGQSDFQLTGKVLDKMSGEPLVGVNIKIKDKVAGTITDFEGKYNLSTRTEPPFVLIFSSVGYAPQEVKITNGQRQLDVTLEEQVLFGDEVIVSASRYEENLLESPVTVEKLDIIDIQQVAAPDFYSSLNTLKGVDINNQSLTFKVINTRGFTNNTNERFNQIVDGVDNAPPGLNFAAGNIFGLPELDVESVELLVGASSALYGPGGMNGTLLMTSKNPFDYQGLSAKLQTGLMHVGADYIDNPQPLYDFSIRYAKAYNDKIGFKVNATYLSAIDWHANDTRNKIHIADPTANPSEDHYTNPGYDGVNVYGDENVAGVDLSEQAQVSAEGFALSEGLVPGTPEYDARVSEIVSLFPSEPTTVTRTGYLEESLVDYDTRNINISGAVHYRMTDDLEWIVQGAYGNGTAVYTAQNRFSLQNFEAYTGKVELKGSNFFVRAFYSQEDAGNTYDAGSTALQLNERWRGSEEWFTDYFTGFITGRALFGLSQEGSYEFARSFADNRDRDGNIIDPSKGFARPLPGSSELEALKDEVRSTALPNGTLVVDKSAMWHFEGMYNFSKFLPGWDALAGYSLRIYRLNTEGTTYFDTPGNPIIYNQGGAYAQIGRRMFADRLKVTASARYDKNENFDGRITPRGSVVLTVDEDNQRYIRGSVQTAFRFPAVADQWVDLDFGFLQVFGGLPQLREQFGFDTNPVYPADNPNPIIAEPDFEAGPYQFPTFEPERVTAYEIGYKGLHFGGRMMVDAYGYVNTYNGFLATQLLARPNPDGSGATERFSTTVSTDDPLTAFGWALGVDYIMQKGYVLSGNISNNDIESLDSRPAGFQSRFNTPKYRMNASLSNREVINRVGFSVSYRWQDEFLWEANFGRGMVDAFGTVDAQVSYDIPSIKSTVKVGGSNLTNNFYTTGFGNPAVGAVYFVSLNFDELMN
jgi:outer membrane receptor protein involved in Fe transport